MRQRWLTVRTLSSTKCVSFIRKLCRATGASRCRHTSCGADPDDDPDDDIDDGIDEKEADGADALANGVLANPNSAAAAAAPAAAPAAFAFPFFRFPSPPPPPPWCLRLSR